MAVEIRVRIGRSMPWDDVEAVRGLAEDVFPGEWSLTPVESETPTLGVSHDLLMGVVDGTVSFAAHEICEQIKAWLHERARDSDTPPDIEVVAVGADPGAAPAVPADPAHGDE